MKQYSNIFKILVLVGLCFAAAPADAASKAVKCTKLQSKNFMITGKCVNKTDAKAGLKQFTTFTCVTCHSKTGSTCPQDLGTGSCSYAKMATLIKAAKTNPKSVAPSVFIDQFNAYSAFMPGIATPTTAQAKKYILYLSTLKQ